MSRGHLEPLDGLDLRIGANERPPCRPSLVWAIEAGRRPQFVRQQGRKFAPTLEHAQREYLEDQAIGIAFDDQPAQVVALGVNHAVGVGDLIQSKLPAQADRLREPGPPEALVDGRLAVSQHADGDLRLRVEQPVPE